MPILVKSDATGTAESHDRGRVWVIRWLEALSVSWSLYGLSLRGDVHDAPHFRSSQGREPGNGEPGLSTDSRKPVERTSGEPCSGWEDTTEVPGDSPMVGHNGEVDSYSVSEAARLLQVSAKRVRQLAEEGRLTPVEGSSPLRLEAESVLQERKRREESPTRPGPAPAVTMVEPAAVLAMATEIASSVARESVRLALESAEPARREVEAVRARTEEALRESLAAAEARALTAEAKLQEVQEALQRLQGQLEEAREVAEAVRANSGVQSRRLWGRRKGRGSPEVPSLGTSSHTSPALPGESGETS